MNTILIPAGMDIFKAAQIAVDLTNQTGFPTQFNFNGQLIVSHPNETTETVANQFQP